MDDQGLTKDVGEDEFVVVPNFPFSLGEGATIVKGEFGDFKVVEQ